MSTIRPIVSEKNFNRVFELVKISNNKIGFDTALEMVLESIATSASKSHEVEENEDARK